MKYPYRKTSIAPKHIELSHYQVQLKNDMPDASVAHLRFKHIAGQTFPQPTVGIEQ